jgi:hypothetical protein
MSIVSNLVKDVFDGFRVSFDLASGKVVTIKDAMTLVKDVVPANDVAIIVADVQKVQTWEGTASNWLAEVESLIKPLAADEAGSSVVQQIMAGLADMTAGLAESQTVTADILAGLQGT